jgi:diphthamide synthase (EF-2-diphthine--ammonia ligase)
MPKPKALISWSSGKDSAFALHEVRRAGEFDVVGALTTVTETFGRVSIHGVRQEILRAQCDAAQLPQRIVPIPYPCPNEVYEARMGEAVASAVREGITHMIFGDLFLADIRAYREQKLAGTGITPVFPLWERPTAALAQTMIASGLEAHIATVDLKKLSAEFAGRPLRRERRVPHLRGGGADVFVASRCRHRRMRRARRLCLLRSGAQRERSTPSSAGSPMITAAAIRA